MKPTLLIAGVLGATALFAGSAGIIGVEQHASAGTQPPALQALNPQPLPPRIYIPVNPGDPFLPLLQPFNGADELNPQPLPPGPPDPIKIAPLLQGVATTLNPQPLPPGRAPAGGTETSAVFPS